jgi:O-acetyl-ADP-ribose deacetylase (regulator of RNase III)
VVELVEGDITAQAVDAVVNAANTSLLGGGGVDGAIHRAGGPAILEECRPLGGCETGDAKMTGAGRLPARKVIHAVGPVYGAGGERVANLLARCHRRALELASSDGLRSVAFPAISTGAYGYPLDEAAHVALRTVVEELPRHPAIELVRFVLYGHAPFRAFSKALDEIVPAAGAE